LTGEESRACSTVCGCRNRPGRPSQHRPVGAHWFGLQIGPAAVTRMLWDIGPSCRELARRLALPSSTPKAGIRLVPKYLRRPAWVRDNLGFGCSHSTPTPAGAVGGGAGRDVASTSTGIGKSASSSSRCCETGMRRKGAATVTLANKTMSTCRL